MPMTFISSVTYIVQWWYWCMEVRHDQKFKNSEDLEILKKAIIEQRWLEPWTMLLISNILTFSIKNDAQKTF